MVNILENHFIDNNRLIVFVGGFDPRGSRYYHQLMRFESDKQNKVSKKNIYAISKRSKLQWGGTENLEHSCWHLERTSQGDHVKSELVFFDWHDQVQENWPTQRARVFGQAFGTYQAIWDSRYWLKPIQQQARFTLWALMYPLVYMALLLVLGVLLGGKLASVLHVAGWVCVAMMLAGAALAAVLGLMLDRHIHVSWLLRILNFAHLSSTKAMPVLDARIDAMADALAEKMRQGCWSEVVIVGFSVGSVQSVKLTAALRARLKSHTETDSVTASAAHSVSLVTLGNCIPLFGLFPGASNFRRVLREVALDQGVFWADISSPSDSVCFGMCDVVGLSLREDGETGERKSHAESSKQRVQWGFNPQAMCSPRFHKLFKPETYRWLRRNKMRMHFQYLMAGEVAGAYDYFELLTAPGSVRSYIEKKLVR